MGFGKFSTEAVLVVSALCRSNCDQKLAYIADALAVLKHEVELDQYVKQ